MIVVLSPAKRLDYESVHPLVAWTIPDMLLKSQLLVEELRSYPTAKLAALMHLSDKLAVLNAQRFRDFHVPFTTANARQSLLAFKGDVYAPLEVDKYSDDDFFFAQAHIRILSGLYGVLRPLDLIQPYRLEMGTKLKTRYGKDLYAFWGDTITEALNHALSKEEGNLLINLASAEYFKAVKVRKLNCPVIHITFKEKKGRQLRVVGIMAKKARGMMANYIIRKRVNDPAQLKKFKEGGYVFDRALSSEKEYVFVRKA